MIQQISSIRDSIEPAKTASFNNRQSLSNDLWLFIYDFFTSQDLANLPKVNKQLQTVVRKFYKRTDSLNKLISVSSHILCGKHLSNNDQFIEHDFANRSLNLLDVVQGKTYSRKLSAKEEECLFNSRVFHIFHNQLACVSDSKICYITLRENVNSPVDYSFNFPKRGHSLYSLIDSSERFAIVAKEDQDSDVFIDIINIENRTILTIEDREVRRFRPSAITIHQDTVYVAYINWNTPLRNGYANPCDLIKAYSLTTKEVLHSYACNFPRQILIGDQHLVVSQDTVRIQIFDKQDGTLVHTIDPALNCSENAETGCGYICSLFLYKDKIVAGLKDNRIKLWSIQTGELIKTIDLNLIEAYPSLYADLIPKGWEISLTAKGWKMDNFIINERYLAIIKNLGMYLNFDRSKGIKNKIFIFDMEKYRPVYAFEAINTITSLKFNSNQLIATLEKGQVQSWDFRWTEERIIDTPNVIPSALNQSSVERTNRTPNPLVQAGSPIEIPTSLNNTSPLVGERSSPSISSQNRNGNIRRFSVSFIQNWYKQLVNRIKMIIDRFIHWFRQRIRK